MLAEDMQHHFAFLYHQDIKFVASESSALLALSMQQVLTQKLLQSIQKSLLGTEGKLSVTCLVLACPISKVFEGDHIVLGGLGTRKHCVTWYMAFAKGPSNQTIEIWDINSGV